MTSNKTLATLFLITLNMQRAAASSPKDLQESGSSGKSVLRVRKPGRASKPKNVLADTTNTVDPVEVQDGSTGVISTSQKLPVPQVDNQFKTLIEKGEYKKIFELSKKMNDEEFLNQLCQVIETLDQYKGAVDHLKGRKMVASFYIHGDIKVVEGAIVESRVYDVNNDYFKDGDLETALLLALEEDKHDRFVELLDVRREITAEKDRQLKLKRRRTSFEWFVYHFIANLTPWEDGVALRRFLILRGGELRNKYHDILDTLCLYLMDHLSLRLPLPKAERLLVDLIGQPSLLTPVVFARGFLRVDVDENHSNFIKYGWREAIQEGLKEEYYGGGKRLWKLMKMDCPTKFFGEFPDTDDALDAVLAEFPTKRQKEEQWIKENAPNVLKELEPCEQLIGRNAPSFLNKFESLFYKNFLLLFLIRLILEYAIRKLVPWLDV